MSIEEVRALVAERQRYDDWLAALEAKRTETPVRVFERVHGDYTERRAQVIAQLQSHVDSLVALGNDLEGQLDALDAQLSSLEDERAEAMLRNLVGEYDNDRWDAVRVEVDSKVETLTAERSAVLTQFDDVRTLLASARVNAEAEAGSDGSADGVARAEAETLPAAEGADVSSGTQDGHSLVDLGSQFNLAAIEAPAEDAVDVHVDVSASVVESSETAGTVEVADAGLEVEAIFEAAERIDRHTPRAHDVVTHLVSEIPAEPAAGAASAPAQTDEYEDALAMFAEPEGTPDAGFVQSLEGIEVEADEPGSVLPPRDSTLYAEPTTATVTPPTGSAADQVSPIAPSADSFDDLAFLRSVIDPSGGASSPASSDHALPTGAQSEPQKTLRCTECGTMNLPTEWYCERCGGELAAF